MGRDNAGQRVLSARHTTTGSDNSLAGYIGVAIPDGAQCFVLQEQTNYRWLATSVLPADGKFVVQSAAWPKGRWVREAGLVGFAMLTDGTLQAQINTIRNSGVFRGYKSKQLVQFEVDDETFPSWVRYIGSVPRMALITGSAALRFEQGSMDLTLFVSDRKERLQSAKQHVAVAGGACVTLSTMLCPGDEISMHVQAAEGISGSGDGSLVVVLA